jgi:hypothetical protein
VGAQQQQGVGVGFLSAEVVGQRTGLVVEVERVPEVARRMKLGDVEGFEVVVVGLDLGAFDGGEADAGEDGADFFQRLGEDVANTGAVLKAGESKVKGFSGRTRSLELLSPLFQRGSTGRAGVELLPGFRLELRAGRKEPVVFACGEPAALAAEPRVAQLFQASGVAACATSASKLDFSSATTLPASGERTPSCSSVLAVLPAMSAMVQR